MKSLPDDNRLNLKFKTYLKSLSSHYHRQYAAAEAATRLNEHRERK